MVERLAIWLAVEIVGGRPHPRSFTGGRPIVHTARLAGLLSSPRRRTHGALADVVGWCYALNPGYHPPGIVRLAMTRPSPEEQRYAA